MSVAGEARGARLAQLAVPGFEPIVAGRIEDRDQADHAGVALQPLPGEALQGEALAADLIEVAADILDGGDAGREQRAMRRVPLREVGDGFASGRFLVFRQQIFDLRAVAMRPERGGERMIDASRVDADQLHFLFDQPLRRGFAQARRVAEIFLAVGVFAVPAGIDQHDVVGLDLGRGLFQIGRLDQLPFALGDRERDAGAEEGLQRQLADRGGFRDQVDRRVHMRRGMEDGDDLVRHHALLGVMRDALELDLLVAGMDRRIHAPRMAEFDEGKPAFRINHLCHHWLPLNVAARKNPFGPRPAGGADCAEPRALRPILCPAADMNFSDGGARVHRPSRSHCRRCGAGSAARRRTARAPARRRR